VKKLLLMMVIISSAISVLASPREDLRWIYEKAFGSDSMPLADINIELLKRCSIKRKDYDAQACKNGERMFYHALKVFTEKTAQETGSLSLSDNFGTMFNKVSKAAEASIFAIMNNPETFKQRLINS
jgi:hypothetical protein